MIDDRLTEDIEVQAKARPRYSTEIITTDGGWEVRNSRWSYPLHRFEFNLSPNARDAVDFVAFRDLFYAAGGAHETFLFRHWADYFGDDELIGTGNGAETEFQLVRNYTRGITNRTRKITRPEQGTVIIRVDGVVRTEGVHYTVDYDTGLVTFGVAPLLNQIIRADFEFDVPVRFEDDEVEFVGLTDELEQPVDIVLIEVKE